MVTGKTNSIVPANAVTGMDAVEGINTTESKRKSDKKQVDIEIGGPAGPEPTRYGDWEKGGRCTDF